MGFREADLYAILGINHTTSPEEIKKAYKQQVFLHHPDKQGPPQLFLEITRAYEILSNPQKKAEYDHARNPKIESFEYTLYGTVKIRKEALDEFMGRIERTIRDKTE